MIKLLLIAALIAPVPALAGEFERMLEDIYRRRDKIERDFWADRAAGEARADRMAAEAEASSRADAQQRALDSINMQLYQMNTR